MTGKKGGGGRTHCKRIAGFFELFVVAMAVVRVLLEFLGNFIFIFIFQGPEKSLKNYFGKRTFGKLLRFYKQGIDEVKVDPKL